MEREYYILMADIIKSSEKNQGGLMQEFKHMANHINETSKKSFLSPITVTLGDEFQSVLTGPKETINAIFQIEEEIVLSKNDFKLRYVLLKGEIDTPINKNIAHEMMGPGLTKARQSLEKIKKGKKRFNIDIGNEKNNEVLNNSFIIYQTIIDNWRVGKDYDLVGQFFKHFDYKVVAEKTHKTRSQIWKRRKSLMIEEYFALKKIIEHVGSEI